MDYDFDDEDILEENNDFSMNYNRGKAQVKQPAAKTTTVNANTKSVATAAKKSEPQTKSNMNYGDDFGFSDLDDDVDNDHNNKQNQQNKTDNNDKSKQSAPPIRKRSASPSPVTQKRVDNQKPSSLGFPAIQPVLRASQFDDSDELNNDKKSSYQPKKQSAVPSANPAQKPQQKQQQNDFDLDEDLDDIDDIQVVVAVPPKNHNNQNTSKKNENQHKKDNEGEEEDYNEYQDDDENAFEPTTEQKKNKNHDDDDDGSGSELSELPELEYDDPTPPPQFKKPADHVASSESFLINPISKENRSTRLNEQSQSKQDRVGGKESNASNSNRTNERRNTVDSLASKATTAAGGGSRAGANSRDSRMKPPTIPLPTGLKKNVKKIGGDELKELLRDRDYERMTFKEIKGENDELREKLRSFNAQLTEKVEQSQAIITKQAAEKAVAQNKPRTRSNQMRTADAETDNNLKIMKRLEEELTKLCNRQTTLENPQYSANLKVQVETSVNLINKFKLQAKQIQLKNDQQAKELNKLSKVENANDGVKEGHGIQQELQLIHDKIKELEKKRVDFEDLFVRKSEAIDVKEVDLAKKIKEAKSLGVNVNLNSAGDSQQKRVAKYREMQKTFEQLEKKNATLQKMHKTKEVLMFREIDEIAKQVLEKDNEIKGIEVNLIGVKSQVQDIIENEKIYGNQNNKQLKEFLERDNAISISEPSEVIAESARKHNPLKSNNLFENDKPLPQSSKPNMKFKKMSDDRSYDSHQQKEEEENTNTASTAKSVNLPTNESGMNFHQKKLHSRTNLNDISNNQEETPQPVSTKPFSLKKNSAGAASEPRIWKPDMDTSIVQKSLQEQQQYFGSPNQTNEQSSSNNPNSFNFNKKLAAQSQVDLTKANIAPTTTNIVEASQENVKPAASSPVVKPAVDNTENIFEKPQRMFRFKRGGDNPSNASDQPAAAPASDLKPSFEQPQTNPTQQGTTNAAALPKDEGYTFSTNSRVSRVRGGAAASNNQPETSAANANSYQPSMENNQPDNLANLSKPIANSNQITTEATSGYSFSGLGGGNIAGVSRRRGGNPSGAAGSNFDDDFKSDIPSQQQQPTQIASQSQNEQFEVNVASRRNRATSKNEAASQLTYPAEQQQQKAPQEAEKKSEESKWSWSNNNNNNENNSSLQQPKGAAGVVTSALDTPFTMDSAPPKTFNFKRNNGAAAAAVTNEQTSVSSQQQIQLQQKPTEPQLQQAPITQQQQQQQQPQVQQQKKDDIMFKGPNDRRITANRTTANDTKKVIKRDIFADEPAEIVLPEAGFMQPKEIGTSNTNKPSQQQQQLQKPQTKKSALDDDDDLDGGLDFLKQDKPKVNYNDDDDVFTSKKPSNQPATSILSSAGTATTGGNLGGPSSKLNIKKTQQDNHLASKQEREKNLAAKAKNEDFFDDLF